MPISATAGRYVREISNHSYEVNNFTSNDPPYVEESVADGGQGAQSLPVIAPVEPKAHGECVGLRDS